MTQVAAGKRPAWAAIAIRIERLLRAGILSPFYRDFAGAYECASVARIAGRQHAIEHVVTHPDACDEIGGRPHPHQVMRLVIRQMRRRQRRHLAHRGFRLADRKPSGRETIEGQCGNLQRAYLPQVGIDAPLHDPEQRLGRADSRAETALGPSRGHLKRAARTTSVRGKRGAFVERHHDIGAEPLLNLHRAFRGEHQRRAIEMRAEPDALLGNGIDLREAHRLVAARIGQYRAGKSHEPRDPAHLADQFLTRPHREVIGIRKNEPVAHAP